MFSIISLKLLDNISTTLVIIHTNISLLIICKIVTHSPNIPDSHRPFNEGWGGWHIWSNAFFVKSSPFTTFKIKNYGWGKECFS